MLFGPAGGDFKGPLRYPAVKMVSVCIFEKLLNGQNKNLVWGRYLFIGKECQYYYFNGESCILLLAHNEFLTPVM